MRYIWQCNKCAGTMELNYHATEVDYLRLKDCGCKQQGTYEFKRHSSKPIDWIKEADDNERW